MTLFAYRRLAGRASASIALLLALVMTTPARALDTISVALDQATLTKMPESASTLVIGNPIIADVTVRPGGLLVVTGKAYGTTNLIVLDPSGAVLSERFIEVTGPREETLVLYRGVERETYSCAPECQPRMMLGDSLMFFAQAMGASSARTKEALTQAALHQAAKSR